MFAIAAIANNLVIGENNRIPWHSTEDAKWFKSITYGKNILVGFNTFLELPKLENRSVFVLTHKNILGSSNKNGLQGNYINRLHNYNDFIICGGASIYKQFLHRCSCLYLTEFDFDSAGDTYFPFNKNQINSLFPYKEKMKDILSGTIYQYFK